MTLGGILNIKMPVMISLWKLIIGKGVFIKSSRDCHQKCFDRPQYWLLEIYWINETRRHCFFLGRGGWKNKIRKPSSPFKMSWYYNLVCNSSRHCYEHLSTQQKTFIVTCAVGHSNLFFCTGCIKNLWEESKRWNFERLLQFKYAFDKGVF